MIFILSAIHPEKHKIAILNLKTVIRQGGILFFRDFGMYDIGQIKNHKRGNCIE